MKNKSLILLISSIVIINLLFLLILNQKQAITGSTISEPAELSSIQSEFSGNKFVSKTIDGDTLIIEGQSVRLLGMDTDERGYPCYKEAKERIEELVLDKEIFLEIDGEDKDQYGRYLRYIFLDGKNINLQMVEEGLAVARFSPQNQKYKQEILAAEKKSREKKTGCKWREETLNDDDETAVKEDNAKKESNQEQKENVSVDSGEYVCDSNAYNCGDFSSHSEALTVFETCGGIGNDIHKLDNDKDGDPCETLT